MQVQLSNNSSAQLLNLHLLNHRSTNAKATRFPKLSRFTLQFYPSCYLVEYYLPIGQTHCEKNSYVYAKYTNTIQTIHAHITPINIILITSPSLVIYRGVTCTSSFISTYLGPDTLSQSGVYICCFSMACIPNIHAIH